MKLITYERKMSADTETPISIYSKYVKDHIGFLLESNEMPRGRYSFMAADPYEIFQVYKDYIRIKSTEDGSVQTLKTSGMNPMETLRKRIESIEVVNQTSLPFIGGAVGTVGYDMIRYYENIDDTNEDSIQTPDAELLFIKECIAYDHYYNQLHLVCLETEDENGQKRAQERFDAMEKALEEPLDLGKMKEYASTVFSSNMSKEEYKAVVERGKQYIYDGDIFQFVPSQRLEGKVENVDTFDLYRKLRQVNPSPYLYYFHMEDYDIVGSSPEMLVSMKDNIIQTCPIAGTRKVASDEEENQRLAKELLEDPKEQAEHMMLVDLGRNDMGKVAAIDSVTVERLMEVERYSHVMHLVSLVSGQKRTKLSMFDVLMSFLPAGTLSGAPKIRAMEIIEELENRRRGIYGGAIGYFGFNGNMDMCIAIRTMVIKNDTIYIQAGAGIVADSDPESEYQETLNKAQALVSSVTV